MTKAKATTTPKATKAKATPKDTTPKTYVAVVCGYCGDSKVFDSKKAAQDWIVEDMRDNGHGANHYEIVVGKKVTLDVKMAVTWKSEGEEPEVITSEFDPSDY